MKPQFILNADMFAISGLENSEWKLKQSLTQQEPDVYFYAFSLETDDDQELPKLKIHWTLPLGDAIARWTPNSYRQPNIPPNWDGALNTSLTGWMPEMLFHNGDGINQTAIAFSDAMRTVTLNGGLSEETCNLEFTLHLFSEPEAPCRSYQGVIRIDLRRIFFADAVRDMTSWYESFPEYQPVEAPEDAFAALYSAWYSYHQDVYDHTILSECREAAPYGMKTVIVDDGWQTDDNNRGYAFCGDWEMSRNRFPDFARHVREVHELGMKYMIWYSVPFVGCKSKNFEAMRPKLLNYIDGMGGVGVLDPRFPEVREFLISKYEAAVRDWGLDGLKLDFIERFRVEGVDPAVADHYAGRDYKNVHEGVDRLMTDIMDRLKAIRPDILVEFRQSYIGPAIRKYGNMLRAADCPADPWSNRRRTIDLRLTSGGTAVHADMLEWRMDDSAENAALQLLNILFSVPQISVRLAELPERHRQMLHFYLTFMETHRQLLLKSSLTPLHPELNYPVIYAQNKREAIAVIYASEFEVVFDEVNDKKVYLVNATNSTSVLLNLASMPRVVTLRDVTGQLVASPILCAGLQKTTLPPSSLLEMQF